MTSEACLTPWRAKLAAEPRLRNFSGAAGFQQPPPGYPVHLPATAPLPVSQYGCSEDTFPFWNPMTPTSRNSALRLVGSRPGSIQSMRRECVNRSTISSTIRSAPKGLKDRDQLDVVRDIGKEILGVEIKTHLRDLRRQCPK